MSVVFDEKTGEYSVQIISSAGEKLYLSEEFADFYFIFKPKAGSNDQCERVPAHKILLVTSSDVFRVMFNGFPHLNNNKNVCTT